MYRLLMCLGKDLALVQHELPLSLQWLLTQLSPTAWEGSMGQRSLYLR